MGDNIFGEIIHSYTRAQAISDGVLHDVSELAREAGFLHPVAIAANAWADAVAWPHDEDGQDETGRAWDVLTMAAHALRAAARSQSNGDTISPVITFTVMRIAVPGARPTLTDLTLHVGSGDDGEAVVTICAPGDN